MNIVQASHDNSDAVVLRGVSKTFERRGSAAVEAAKDVSLSIDRGQVFGFLGPNGAGKTTIIKMVCGLIEPTAGSVRINGHDPIRDRRNVLPNLGVVLEGTRNVYWRLSVWQNLTYFARLKGAGADWRQRAEWLLTELGLADRRNQLVQLLSRGMQQKVAIACALVNDPTILILDEPMLGLDVEAARTVRRWIPRLAAEQGKTVLLTTHRLDMAEEVCDRVAIIRDGALLTDMAVADMLGSYSAETYRITLDRPISGLSAALGDLTTSESDGSTVISDVPTDQECLDSVLRRLLELDLPISRIELIKPNLEDIFVDIMEKED